MTEKIEQTLEQKIDVLDRKIKQSETTLSLIEKEKDYKVELVNIKSKYNTLREGTDKPEFVFKQEFYDVLLKIEEVNLEHYLVNANDAIDQQKSGIEGLKKMKQDLLEKDGKEE